MLSLRKLPLSLSLILLTVGGCGDDGATGGGGSGAGSSVAAGQPATGLPCDVSEILAANCQSCHSAPPKFGAIMPLMTRADLLAAPGPAAPEATVGEAVLRRISATSESMPPPPNMPLSAADQAVLSAYVQAGMPESTDTCGTGGGGQGGGYEMPCVPDVILKPTTPYEMPQSSTDEYICFGVEAPSDVARHITALMPQLDNETIIHHLLLLQAPTAQPATGQPCDFVNPEWKLLYAWGPGTPAAVLPAEAGYPIGPGEPGHFVLQMHYSNLQGLAGETDQTGIGLCTTDQLRPYDADIMAFGGTNFSAIPPNSQGTLECSIDIPAQVAQFAPFNIFQSWPHMHQIGRQLDSYVNKAGGGQVSLASVPNYDFEYQITYPVNVQLEVGDQVVTRCTWDNVTGNPVGFGEETQDEMCFNFVSYYPRVSSGLWHWLLPSYSASCSWQ